MTVESRFDRVGKTYTITEVENAAGGIEENESVSVSDWKFMVASPNPRTRELLRTEFGLEPNSDLLYVTGQYDSLIDVDQILIDDNNAKRYKILGVHPQRSIRTTPDHLALVVMEQIRSAPEGS